MNNISANFIPFYKQVYQDASSTAMFGAYLGLICITTLALAALLHNPLNSNSRQVEPPESTFSQKSVALISLTSCIVVSGAALGAFLAVVYNIAHVLWQSKHP